jgi:hypothetical protein
LQYEIFCFDIESTKLLVQALDFVCISRQNDQRLFLKNELQPLEVEKARVLNELLVGFLIKRISLSPRSPAKTVDYK